MIHKLALAFDAPPDPGRPKGAVILWDDAEQTEIAEIRGKGHSPASLTRHLRMNPGYEEADLDFVDAPQTDPRTSAWFGFIVDGDTPPQSGPYAFVGGESLTPILKPVTTHKCTDCSARRVCAVNRLVKEMDLALEISGCPAYRRDL